MTGVQTCALPISARISKWSQDSSTNENTVKVQVEELINNYMNVNSYPKRIFVSMIGKIIVVHLSEVIYFGASGPYTKIYLKSGEIVTCSESIKSYSESLAKHPDFIRIHRSYMINKFFASSIVRKPSNFSVKMSNDEELPIAQQRRAEILKLIMK